MAFYSATARTDPQYVPYLSYYLIEKIRPYADASGVRELEELTTLLDSIVEAKQSGQSEE